MSLHQLAQHMQKAGRGDDTMLVHMTPGEVHGLQALALASGGSLTINPETGLPEAGWLKKFLPVIAGMALNTFAPGVGSVIGSALGATAGSAAATALGTGVLTGGLTALATGSLKEGLAAGIGAYGGATLGNSIGALGSGGSAAPTVSGAVESKLAPTVAGSTAAPASGTIFTPPVPTPTAAVATAPVAPPVQGTPFNMPGPSAVTSPSPAVSQSSNLATPATADQIKAGFGKMSDMSPEELKKLAWDNKGKLAMAAAPMLVPDKMQMPKSNELIRPYTLQRRDIAPYESDRPFNSTAEQRYFDYDWVADTPYKAPGPEYKSATGGIVALATGGESSTMPFTITSSRPSMGGSTTSGTSGTQVGKSGTKTKGSVPGFEFDQATGTWIKTATNRYDPTTAISGEGSTAAPSPATATQIANTYNSVFRRPPTMEELRAGMDAGMTSKDLYAQLKGSDEYLTNLTKPFVPRTTYENGRYSVEGALTPYQSPAEKLGLTDFYDYMNNALAQQAGRSDAYAQGGMTDGDLGGYSDGGRLLRGPGDGVSDSIPAVIGSRQPARLADGEFVVPARIVSELGNGSTEAGARKLYAMMDRVQGARRKSMGKKKVAVNSRADKHLPA